MKINIRVLCALSLTLGACSTYKAAPVDLERDTAQWLTISKELTKQGKSLNQKDLLKIGLLLNPELNALRLTHAKSTSVAEFAGLWEDPSLEGELARNLSESVTNYAIAPSITLPVTGLPSLSKKIAEQYQEVDYWNVRAAEKDFLASMEELCIDYLLNKRKQSLINKRLAQLRTETKKVSELNTLGEASFAEKQIAQQRVNELLTEKQNAEDAVLDAGLALAKALGLHPSAKNLKISDFLPRSTPALLGAPRPSVLLDDARLKSALASYGANELELKREIRKQYPELSLTPGFKHEGGEDELGLGLGMNIPLWNRNREAIASSTAQRDIQSHATITQWRELLTEADALAEKEKLSRRHCISEAERLANLATASSTQEKLYELGELGISELSEMRHERFLREISYLDHLSLLLKAQAQIKRLNPHSKL